MQISKLKEESIMAKRKTEKKEEEKLNDSVEKVPKKEVKKKPVKKVEKINKKEIKETEVKKTLLQLIEESDKRTSFIIGALSFNNMLNVLEEEKYNVEKGLFVKPVMTDSEFNKIIKDFLNRRI